MVRPLESSVVRVFNTVDEPVGTGFLVYPDYIVTCAHVVADALGISRYTIEAPSNTIDIDFPRVEKYNFFRASVVFWRPVNSNSPIEDIACLKLEGSPPTEVQPAWLLPALNLEGNKFETFGFPEGRDGGAWSYGRLRGTTAERWIQLERTSQDGYGLEGGFSGAPIWDLNLEALVGMAVAIDPDRIEEIKVGFMIPADVLIEAYPELGERPICPYQGLSDFDEDDQDFFFGREGFVQKLVQAVQELRLVSVVGPSGCGKSSVVKAGLIPQLKANGQWEIISIRPGDRPFWALATVLAPYLYPQAVTPNEELERIKELKQRLESPDNNALREVMEVLGHPRESILLFIDQFEELYTLCDRETRESFINSLIAVASAAKSGSLGCSVLLTLRADFLGEALSNRSFADLIEEGDQLLGPMNHQELKSAITKPAAALGVVIEDGLTQRLLDDVGNEPGNLPLLEFTLTQLWGKLNHAWLTNRAYDEIEYVDNDLTIRGVKAALVNYAEEKYDQLREEVEKKQVRQVFMGLIKPGEGTPDTRRIATRKDIGEEKWELVDRLAKARLVVTDQYSKTDSSGQEIKEEIAEIVHEALIKEWPRLQHWLTLDRDFRIWQERLKTRIQQWKDANQDEKTLLQGAILLRARTWLTDRPSEISDEERGFIDRSYRVGTRKRRRTTYSLIGFSAILSVLIVVAIFFATAQANEKVKVRTSLSAAKFARNQRLDAIVEGIRAFREFRWLVIPYKETKEQVENTLPELVYGIRERNRFNGHNGKIEGVSFSPNGQFIASASEDQTVKLWNQDGKLLATLEGHTNWVNKASFSPDSKHLVTVSSDATVKLWGVECLSQKSNMCMEAEVTPIKTLSGHKGWVTDVEFSSDGKTLVTASRDGTVKIWNCDGILKQNISVKSEAWGVSFSPDGEKIATANGDGTVKVFNPEGVLLKTLSGHKARVRDVSFNSDGQLIASSGDDNIGIIWKPDGSKTLLEGHEGHVNRVTFSPDNEIIATVSDGDSGNIKLWRKDGTSLATFNGHTARVKDAVFSPDGQVLVTGSWDATVRLWSLSSLFPDTLQGHKDRVMDTSFDPNSQVIASASWDKTVKIWSLNGTLLQTLEHDDRVNDVIFSPDGELIVAVTSRESKNVVIWNRDGTQKKVLTGHTDYIRAVSFSPDGQKFATAGGEKDKTVKIWSRKGELLKTLEGHTDGVYGVSFSPDGDIIASAGKDNTIKLWNQDGDLLKTLEGHEDWIWNISFRRDDRVLASASEDGTVKLWSKKGKEIKTLKGHSARVSDVEFSPNGELIATGSADGTIKLWNRDGRLLTTLGEHDDRVMSVNFSSDGKTLVSTSVDNTIKFWNVQNQRFTDDLSVLVMQGCNWIEDFLETNQELEETDRRLCQ